MDYQSEDPERVAPTTTTTSTNSTPSGSARKTPFSPIVSPRGALSGADGVWTDQASFTAGGGGGGGSVVTVTVVFAPHQLMHSRTCVDQVSEFYFHARGHPPTRFYFILLSLFFLLVGLGLDLSVLDLRRFPPSLGLYCTCWCTGKLVSLDLPPLCRRLLACLIVLLTASNVGLSSVVLDRGFCNFFCRLSPFLRVCVCA